MLAPFDARSVQHRTVGCVLGEDLALQNAAILERQMKHVAERGVRHRVEAYDSHRPVKGLQAITHTPQVAMTTMQTPDSPKRLPLRHLLHTSDP